MRTWSRALLALLLMAFAVWGSPSFADSLSDKLRTAVKARYRGVPGVRPLKPGMSAYRIVPYRDKYFAYTSGWDSDDTALCAVWEYLGGRWYFIFEHGTRGSIEGDYGNFLDPLYARHGFSSKMRRKLTGGPIKDF